MTSQTQNQHGTLQQVVPFDKSATFLTARTYILRSTHKINPIKTPPLTQGTNLGSFELVYRLQFTCIFYFPDQLINH